MKKRILVPVLAAFSCISLNVLASDDIQCSNTPKSEWLSEEEIKAKAIEMGYDVRRLKVDDGCYEINAIDPDGRKVEVYFHPITAEVVKTEDD